MKVSKALFSLTLCSLVVSIIEKLLSVYGQSTYPNVLYETTPMVSNWILMHGLIPAHVLAFLFNMIPLAFTLSLQTIATKTLSKLPIHRKICFTIAILLSIYCLVIGLYTIWNNVSLIQYAKGVI